ncbi:lysophospholipase L1 [Clostridium sp. CAG:762]|mgnify:FL=1|nr:lysophospholipase L1 [Clostridium sp. CAG:762]
MKKIIFTIILFLSCYLIYTLTNNNNLNYVTLGDSLSKGVTPYFANGYGYSNYIVDYLKKNNKLNSYNDDFTSVDYRITDLINLININYETNNQTINQAIHSADIITISVGMQELYYKINTNDTNIYTYIDKMLEDTEELFTLIRKNNNKKIYMLGYYNTKNTNQDLFNYANIKLKEICQKNKITYIDTQSIFYKNTTYFENPNSFNPNLQGYYKIYEKIIEKF